MYSAAAAATPEDDTVADATTTITLAEQSDDKSVSAVTSLPCSPQALSHRPASLRTLPELNIIIRDCWQQRDLRRPTAALVLAQLQALMQRYRE
jgi:hypothetical protein